MSLGTTLIILGICVAAFAFANYKSRQPYVPGQTTLVPYVPIQFIALVGIVLMIAHLVTLVSGQPFVGRFG